MAIIRQFADVRSITPIKDVLQSATPIDSVQVQGWVRTRRDSKDFSFIELNDGSTLRNLQIIARDTLPNYPAMQRLSTGASISVNGELIPSQGKGQKWELVADNVEIVGSADDSYPLQKKGHTPEFLREIAHLRPRSNLFGVSFASGAGWRLLFTNFFRSGVSFMCIRRSLPAATAKEPANCFALPRMDAKNLPRTTKGEIDYAKDFFAPPTYLTVSGQLEAEAFALALSNVYTFGPTFRAENSNTSRHANEFWMIEPEMAFCDLEGNMDLAEEICEISDPRRRATLPGRAGACSEVRGQGIAWRDSTSSSIGRFNGLPIRKPSNC